MNKKGRTVRAITPVLAILLMIVITVAAALVTYAWVMGYLGLTAEKAGQATQIQSVALVGNDLKVYVQNVGEGVINFNENGDDTLYVNGLSVEATIDKPHLGEGETATFTAPSQEALTGQTVTIKVVSRQGTFSESTTTVFSSALPGYAQWHFVNTTSNVDGVPNKGTHSNFADQRIGPDSLCDVLTEEDTDLSTSTVYLINQESFEGSWPPSSPASWSETGQWNREGNREYHGSYSADFDGSGSGVSGNLVTCDLDCSDAVSISVEFRFYDERLDSNELLLDYYDGSVWVNIADLGAGSGWTWALYEQQITDSRYFTSHFRIRWRANDIEGDTYNEHAYVDFVTVTKEVPNVNYEVDLEIQFTDIDLGRDYTEICIKTGLISGENLEVYVWTGSTWELLLSPLLSNQWQNVTRSITTEVLTLRFLGSLESNDPIQDTWEIDCTVLYAPP